jgi:hypothetical protein
MISDFFSISKYTIKIVLISILLFIFVINYFSLIESLSLVFAGIVVCNFFRKFGSSLCFLELIELMTVLTCLLAPMLFYHYFNQFDELLKFFNEMEVPAQQYFTFTFPAIIFFSLGLKLKFRNAKNSKSFSKIDFSNKIPSYHIYILLFIGIISSVLSSILPTFINQIFVILSQFIYVGFLYLWFSDARYKLILLLAVSGFFLFQVIQTGMYTGLINFGSAIVIIITSIKNISWLKKLRIAIVSILLIMFVQLIKVDYRLDAWAGSKKTADASMYFNVITKRISEPSILFEPISFMELAKRFNHGYIISMVLYNVPKHVDYGYGKYLGKSLISSFFPRFLWPTKPMTGGAYNISYFFQDYNSVQSANSYNLGIIGEGYAHFGYFAFLYLFFVGRLIRLIYLKFLSICERSNLLIFWSPIIFTTFYVIETDFLALVNGVVKSSLVLYLIVLVSRKYLRFKF